MKDLGFGEDGKLEVDYQQKDLEETTDEVELTQL